MHNQSKTIEVRCKVETMSLFPGPEIRSETSQSLLPDLSLRVIGSPDPRHGGDGEEGRTDKSEEAGFSNRGGQLAAARIPVLSKETIGKHSR